MSTHTAQMIARYSFRRFTVAALEPAAGSASLLWDFSEKLIPVRTELSS
jgi:hypothetical protein